MSVTSSNTNLKRKQKMFNSILHLRNYKFFFVVHRGADPVFPKSQAGEGGGDEGAGRLLEG